MNYKLNEEKAEIDKWDMNFDDLMNYEYVHDSWIQSILIIVKISQQQHKEIMLTECKLWNNWLFYYNNFIVSNFEFLRFKILEFAHDAAIVEHSDCAKIYEIIQQVYYWLLLLLWILQLISLAAMQYLCLVNMRENLRDQKTHI